MTSEPLDDLAAEMLQEALIEKALSGEDMTPAPAPAKRRAVAAAPVEVEVEYEGEHDDCEIDEPHKHSAAAADEPEADEVRDFGPYCVECREDTTGMDGRTPAQMAGVEVVPGGGDDGGELVKSVLYKGWKCEGCQPFEASIIEDSLNALAERRYDPADIRRRMRAMGDETIWANWIGPMLDQMEEALGLEIE
jgi:hypothetical protein